MGINTERRNQIEQIMPEGLIVTREWLQDTMNLEKLHMKLTA